MPVASFIDRPDHSRRSRAVLANELRVTNPADDVVAVYRKHATLWGQMRGDGQLEAAWLERFLGTFPSPRDVLDIGCGSGRPIAQALIGRGCAVTGIDAAPEMIAAAQADLPTGEWITADMRTLDLKRKFSGIIAWHSLFHLPPTQQRSMFAVFARHARPGALLLFTSGHEAGERIGTLGGSELYHASLAPEEYQRLLLGHGFETIKHLLEDPNCGGATVWLARHTI